MSKITSQKALLDKLMGVDRDVPLNDDSSKRHKWSDRNVCEYFLCGLCPYDQLIQTKCNMGECTMIHDHLLRKEFEKEPFKIQKPVRYRFYRFLKTIKDDLKERIRANLKRVEMLNSKSDLPENNAERDKKIKEISVKIDSFLTEMEKLGEEGRVDESKTLMDEIEKLQNEKKTLLSNEIAMKIEVEQREKRLKLCEICGSYLIINDTYERTESHLEGKLHIGYQAIHDSWVEVEKIDFDASTEEEKSPSPRKRKRSRSSSRRHSRRSHRRKRSRERKRESRRDKDRSRRH